MAVSDPEDDGVARIRARAGMYIGSTGPLGLAHLVFALVHDALARARAGGSRIDVWTHPALIVADDGPVPDADAVSAWLDAPATPPVDPEVHAELAIDRVVPVALSSLAVATFDGAVRRQRAWVRGREVLGFGHAGLGPAAGRGTQVALWPDPAIFGASVVPIQVLHGRLEELAVLDPGIAFSLDGQDLPSHGGLAGFVAWSAGVPAGQVAHRVEAWRGYTIEVAVAWGGRAHAARAWANGLPADGHPGDGLRDGLAGTPKPGRVAMVRIDGPPLRFLGRQRREVRLRGMRAAIARVVREAVRTGGATPAFHLSDAAFYGGHGLRPELAGTPFAEVLDLTTRGRIG